MYYKLGLIIGLMSIATPSFGVTLSVCYALTENRPPGKGNAPQTQINRICLSDSGESSLQGPEGFHYEFYSDVTFQPSAYGCGYNRHTGDSYCGYSNPYFKFFSRNEHVWLNAVIEIPAMSKHGLLSVWFDREKYIFGELQSVGPRDTPP